MWQRVVFCKNNRPIRTLHSCVLVFSLFLVNIALSGYTVTTHINASFQIQHNGTACAGTDQLGGNALLAILLDRSGSLIASVGKSPPTDPDGYSGSVTKALADLWPGNVAVIPFGNDQANVLGNRVFPHSDANALSTLKQLIDANPPQQDANTPLGLAMNHAVTLFQQQDIPSCSQVVLITDGQPTGPQALLDQIPTSTKWFQDHAIPVNAFALALDKNSTGGQDAETLLKDITQKTSGKYTPVVDATSLASKVISLYASWQKLSFTLIKKEAQNGYYPVVVDSRVQQATIIVFHSKGVQVSALTTRSGNLIPPDKLIMTPPDVHYQIDQLVSPITPDTYTLTVGSDPATSVYALVASTLKVEFTGLAATAYIDHPFTIKAHFTDEHGLVAPQKGQPTHFLVKVTEVLGGKDVSISTLDLVQSQPGSDLYEGTYAVPDATALTGKKPGEREQLIGSLKLEMTATYIDATRSVTTTLPLSIPAITKQPIFCDNSCVRQQIIQTLTKYSIPAGAVLSLLLLTLLWRRQLEPIGSLQSKKKPQIRIQLSDRAFLKKLLNRTTIGSDEIADHAKAIGGFQFDVARFVITSRCSCKGERHKHQDHLCLSKDHPSHVSIVVKKRVAGKLERQAQTLTSPQACCPLASEDIIAISGREVAIYN